MLFIFKSLLTPLVFLNPEKKENTENERVATMKIIMHCTLKDQTSSSSYKHERAPDQPFQVILQHLFPRP